MRKILFVIEGLYAAAGIERVSTNLLNVLTKNGFDVSVALFGTDKTTFFQLDESVKLYTLGVPFANKYKLRAAIQLADIAKKISPDYVVNVAVPMMQVTVISKILGMPGRIITWEHFNFKVGSRWGRIFRLFSGLISHDTIVLTEQDRCNYPLFLRNKIIAINNLVPEMEIKSSLMNKIVLSIGRLNYQKGFDILLDIWQEVVKVHSDWILQIIGSGEDKDMLVQKIKLYQLEHTVQMIPTVSNIQDYYQNASIYVMSSRFEGLPTVLIEAKSYNLPIVSFDCPHGPRTIINDEIDGYLILPNNCLEMAKKISLLIEDFSLRKKLGEAGNLDYTKRFSEKSILFEWSKILQ